LMETIVTLTICWCEVCTCHNVGEAIMQWVACLLPFLLFYKVQLLIIIWRLPSKRQGVCPNGWKELNLNVIQWNGRRHRKCCVANPNKWTLDCGATEPTSWLLDSV
jgi:hypothetical protein